MKTKYTFTRVLLLAVLLFVGLPSLWAQGSIPIDDPSGKYGGVSLVQSDRGTGAGLYYEWSLNSANRIGAHANLLVVRGKNDYPLYDPWTGYTFERHDKKRLILLPVFATYKRVLFVDKIANNFRPFLAAAAGPIISFDPPNIPDFADRMKDIQVGATFGARVGIGMDFLYTMGTLISLFIGYEQIEFADALDGSDNYDGIKNYSGITVTLGIGKKY